MIRRLATSLSNENTAFFSYSVFDWFQSELHISGAQQKQTYQINQCLFVAQRALLHFCFGLGFYLYGSHETNRALQILISFLSLFFILVPLKYASSSLY